MRWATADTTPHARANMDLGIGRGLKARKQTFWEDIMRRWIVGLLLLIGTPALAQQAVPSISFDSVANPLRLPPNIYFGEVSGVSVNSKGHIFVLSRGNTSGPAYAAAATQLLEFDAKGQFVREIGKNLYAWSFGHTVKVDPADNIWVTDKGSDMVIKFDPEGRVVMVFGRKQEASDEDTAPLKHPKPPLQPEDGRFRQVTDVAWDKAGDAFISDGYINSRVAKVDKDGSHGETPARSPVNSTRRIRLRPTPMTTSMSPIAATVESRSSTGTANSCDSSRSTCQCRRMQSPRSAGFPTRR
jgi:hypothetical protein